MMRVCLIGYFDEGQYGLRCLESTLEEAGHEVDLVVLKGYKNLFMSPTETEFSLLCNLVKDITPDLFGITVRSPFMWMAKEITERLRPLGKKIIWGGFHTTVAPEYSIKRPDMILRGEADRTFPMLVDELSNDGDLAKIPGLWWKEGGKIRKNPLGPTVEDLDSLPLPLFRREHRFFIEGNKLIEDEPLLHSGQGRFYSTMASRGCPQQCTYCANAALIGLYGIKAKKLRLRNPHRIAEEVSGFQEVCGKVDIVPFMDEVFGYKPAWVREFCEVWKRKVGLNFNAEIHPSLVSEEQIASLANAGLLHFNMGVQSGSERIRREVYHRPVSNEQILKAANMMRRNGVGYRVEFIYGNPLEDAEELKETYNLMLQLPRPHVTMRYRLTYFPGTPLTERFLKEGIISREDVQGYSEERTRTWAIEVDLTDGHSPDYYFYMCLLWILEFRWYWYEPPDIDPKPHFYPRWLVRWLEKRSWLRRNPKAMLKLADKMGKIAHWSYFWFSFIPKRLFTKSRTFFRLVLAGDMRAIMAGFKALGHRIALQMGVIPGQWQTNNGRHPADSP